MDKSRLVLASFVLAFAALVTWNVGVAHAAGPLTMSEPEYDYGAHAIGT